MVQEVITLARILEESAPGSLLWNEIKRHGPKEFFGYDPEDILPDSISGDIPEGIGEGFKYKLELPGSNIYFSQEYIGTSPLSAIKFLAMNFSGNFEIGSLRNEAFNLLSKWLMIRENEKGPVYLSSHSLGIQKETSRSENFTEEGYSAVKTLFSQLDKLARIPGLREADASDLGQLLKDAKTKLEAKKIYLELPYN